MPPTANNIPLQNYQGLAISWGLGTTTITVGGVNVGLGQSSDVTMKTEIAVAKDQRGTTVQRTNFDPTDTGTMEFVFAIAGSYDTGTASITYPTQGTMVVVVAGDASDPLSGSNWIIDEVAVRATNVDAKKVSMKVTRYAGIQQ
jgi:hypothetical protein